MNKVVSVYCTSQTRIQNLKSYNTKNLHKDNSVHRRCHRSIDVIILLTAPYPGRGSTSAASAAFGAVPFEHASCCLRQAAAAPSPPCRVRRIRRLRLALPYCPLVVHHSDRPSHRSCRPSQLIPIAWKVVTQGDRDVRLTKLRERREEHVLGARVSEPRLLRHLTDGARRAVAKSKA